MGSALINREYTRAIKSRLILRLFRTRPSVTPLPNPF